MMSNLMNRSAISILSLLAIPIAGLALGVSFGFFLGLNGTDNGNFITNAVLLLIVFSVGISSSKHILILMKEWQT